MEKLIKSKFENVKVIIPTCDKYIHIIEALMYTVNKYWNAKNEFIVLGYTKPKFTLSDNWKFVSMGEDLGPQYWSNGLIKFLQEFKDEHFILMADDVVMTRLTDINLITSAYEYMLKNTSVKKVFLQGSLNSNIIGIEILGDISYSVVEELNGAFYDVSQTCDYRTSLQSAILSTKYFLETLKENISPWDYELQHIKNDGVRILTTLGVAPTMYGHIGTREGGYLRNWWQSTYEPGGLPSDDIEVIKSILKI